MENIIECNSLTHYYGKRLIYENLSFSVPKGRILGLLGKNGTGKTTTINILSGYLKPHSGRCSIFGQDIQTMHPGTRRNIGLLIEGHVQYQFMTIREIEKFYSAFYPGQWRKEAYYDLMDNDPSTKSYMDFFPPNTPEESLNKSWLEKTLKHRKDYFRRNRDLCIIGMIGVYLVAVVDAYVDASLTNFDISPDLSMQVAPTLIRDVATPYPALGVYWAINF